MSDNGAIRLGDGIEAATQYAYDLRQEAAEERPVTDALEAYAATLSATAHPPQECGDPSSCPGHAAMWWTHYTGRPSDWCEECQDGMPIVEESDETAGFEEQERQYHVIRLACGHEIAMPTPPRRGGVR